MDQPLTISPLMMSDRILVKGMYHANYADWGGSSQVKTNKKGVITQTVIV